MFVTQLGQDLYSNTALLSGELRHELCRFVLLLDKYISSWSKDEELVFEVRRVVVVFCGLGLKYFVVQVT